METSKTAGTAGKILLTVVTAALVSMLLWFIALPEKEYEPTPNQIEHVTISEDIGPSGISQSFVSHGRLKGIRVRWACGGTAPKDDVTLALTIPEKKLTLEKVKVPASEIRHNTETDIVFVGTYEPGEYRAVMTCRQEYGSLIALWESANDGYREGESYDSEGEKESRDWSFSLLTAFPATLQIRHRIERILYAILTVLAGAATTCLIWRPELLKKNRYAAAAYGFARKHADGILIALLILIPTLVYMDFLTGERLYVFTMIDRGADSVGQTYPGLLGIADRIRQGLWGEVFNFRQGLGDSEAAFFPTLTNWVALFGESAVARLMGVSQWLKVVLSGIFAFLFVKEYGAGTAARFLIALGYAFNSMLIARGAWESYPNIALLAILWLYAYERRLNGKGILLPAFATLFMFVNLGLYDCVFYAVLLPGYMLVRRMTGTEKGKKAFTAFLKDFGLFALFALAGMLDTVRYMLERTLSSTRLQEGMEEYGQVVGDGIFSAAEIWMSAFLRTIGHSIAGITWQTGSLNLLEGPAFYTGITALLVTPAALWCMKGKKKAVYLLLVLAAFVYIAVIPLRLVANGFARETFKLSSFWILILLLVFAADFFSRLERGELRRGTRTVLAISALAILALLILGKATGYVSIESDWWISVVFVVMYLILTWLLTAGTKTVLIRTLLILCAAAEAVLVPYGLIHDRCMENADENSLRERAPTREIISSLPDDEWYRIEKDYATVFETDSLAEGYRGSASYLGGVEINSSVLDIYRTFNLPQRGNHYLFGSGGNVYFESAAAVKYVLTRDDMPFRYGYEPLKEENGILVYENRYALPLAFVSQDPADATVLRAEPEVSDTVGYRMDGDTYIFGQLPENSVLIMQATFDQDSRSTVYMEDRDGRTAACYIMGNERTVFEIANPEIYSLWFDSGSRKHLQDISFWVADRDSHYSRYRERSAAAREHEVRIRMEGENRFTGTIRTEEDGYLITAIPYDKKWTVCINEKIQDTIVVNGGFLGAKIPGTGEYQLEIRYDGDSWIKGNVFKIFGYMAFLLTFVVVIFRRRNRQGRKNR